MSEGKLYNPAESADGAPAPTQPARDPETGRFAKPTHIPASLVREAKQFNLTDDDLAEMTSADVRAHVRDAKFEQRIERMWRLGGDDRPRPAQAEPADAPPAEPKRSVEQDLIDDGYDKKISALIGRLHDRIDKLEADTKDLPEFKGHVRDQARQTAEQFGRAVEREFAKHPHIFGAGKIDDIDKDSPEFDFRMAAVKAHRKAGGAIDELADNIAAFVAERFQAKPEPKADDDAAAEWEAGVLGRPTQRGLVDTPAGREKAIEGARAKIPARNGAVQRPARGAYLNSTPR